MVQIHVLVGFWNYSSHLYRGRNPFKPCTTTCVGPFVPPLWRKGKDWLKVLTLQATTPCKLTANAAGIVKILISFSKVDTSILKGSLLSEAKVMRIARLYLLPSKMQDRSLCVNSWRFTFFRYASCLEIAEPFPSSWQEMCRNFLGHSLILGTCSFKP